MEDADLKTLLIVFAIALLIVVTQRDRIPRVANPILYSLLVAIFLLLSGIFSRDCGRQSSDQGILDFGEVCGGKLGEHIAQAFPEGGEVLVLQLFRGKPAGPGGSSPMAEAQIKGLKRGFGKTGLKSILGTLEGGVEILEVIRMGSGMIPEEMFLQALEQAPQAVAVVSCVGVPVLQSLPENLPPIYLLSGADRGTCRSLLSSGVVSAGVFLKSGPDFKTKPNRGMSADEIFNLRYVLVTADALQ